MYDDFDNFDQAFPETSVAGAGRYAAPPLRRRKTIKQRLGFFISNLLVMPIVCLVYASVVADGIRILMPIFRRRLYQLPIPGAGLAKQYDGFDRTDLAFICSILLFVVMTWLWCRIWTELQGFGTISSQRHRSPIAFGLITIIAAIIIIFDAGLFYYGLASQTSNGWSDTPDLVVPGATLVYSCGLAVLGWWHSDYHTSNIV